MSRHILGIAILVLTLVIAGAGYFVIVQEQDITACNPPFNCRPGDTFGKMTVQSIEPFNSGQFSSSYTELAVDNYKLILKGPLEISGTYTFVNSEIGFSGYCMQDFTEPTLAGPPLNSKMFCFRNEEFAEKMLGRDSRKVSVVIDRYEHNQYPSEVINWADLVSISE